MKSGLLAAFLFAPLLLNAQTDPPPVETGDTPPPELESESKPTNVVFILTDNQGAWSLGCYGNPDIKTPNIDGLAKEGVRFTNAFCNNAVCSPTRASYLTGMMPSQHGVHNFLAGGRLQTGPDAQNTLDELRSLPEILKDEGYACGLVGKWHLGGNEKPQEGLEDYWITMPHGGTRTFHGAKIIEDGKIRTEDEHLTTFWTKHALNFIEQEKENPFFLFLSYNGPYGLSRFQLEDLRGPRVEEYAEAEMSSFPDGVIHPWQYNNREYFGNPTAKRRYAAEVAAVDDGVGSVLAKLKEHGLDENTLVVFAADQGWAGGQHGFWGMGDHTRPFNAFEHSMRIPLIFHHPTGIEGGRSPELLVSNYDFLPSVLGYLGMGDLMPGYPSSPGRDYSNVLKSAPLDDWKDEVFYEYENLRCVRSADWKWIERFEDGHDELYDLTNDPDELTNLAQSGEHAAVREQMELRLGNFFAIHAVPEFDLWKGGRSKPRTLLWGEEAKKRQAERDARTASATTPFDLNWVPPAVRIAEPGLVVEVAAAPPLVTHPMMATFDDRGRLFVAESEGLNLKKAELEEQLPNRIRLLEDTNNDGIFDQSTIFADKMTFPQGACWLNGALYVASPPGIWMLIDTDDDGVADIRQQMVTGFEYTGNAADVHGPFLHPNGRLYWCHGRKGHEVYQRRGNVLVSKNKGARIWSMRPDGSDIQVHAGGGMDNPVEIDFTDTGEIIGSVNLFYGRPRGDTLVHWLLGGRYPRFDQGAVLEEFPKTGPVLREAYNFGHVGISGMCLLKDSDDLLTTEFNTQKIQRLNLSWEDAEPRISNAETLLEFNNPDIHLTDVLEDADGSLIVIDTGGWFRLGCPNSQIAKPDIPGAIYRVRRAGVRDRKTDFHGKDLPWNSASYDQLSAWLGDERVPVQNRAISELALYGDEALPALEKTLKAGNETARINTVWTLARMQWPDANLLIRKALNDPASNVQQAACNAWIETQDGAAGAVESLLPMLDHKVGTVQRAALSALGRTKDPAAIPHLARFLGRENLDRYREHSAVFALIELDHFEETLLALQASESAIQIRRILWALDQMPSSELNAETVLWALAQGKEVSPIAFEIARDHPDWAGALAAYFEELLAKGTLGAKVTLAEEVAPAMLSSVAMQQFLAKLMQNKSFAVSAYRAIAASPTEMNLPESWRAPIKSALASSDRETQRAVLGALAQLSTKEFDLAVTTISKSRAHPANTRLAALKALARNGQLEDSSFQFLLDLVKSGTPGDRSEAIAMISQLRPSVEQLQALAKVLPKTSAVDFGGLLGVFLRTKNPKVGQALATALASSPAAANVPPTELRRVLNRFPLDSIQPAETRLSELEETAKNREKRLESLAPRVLSEGDAIRGKKVYESGLGACITCHQIGEKGLRVGPNLSTIGRIRQPRDLMESILFPGASLARDFEAYQLEMKDGTRHFGVIHSENADSLEVVAMGGIKLNLPRAEVKSTSPAPISLMPMGLDAGMSEEQLLDLVRYLDSLE